MLFLWLKAFHIIAMITWFAGLFYLPRLFVYHAMTADEPGDNRFKIMERKLLWGITTPGGVLTIILGALLYSQNFAFYWHAGWMQIKLIAVFLLIIFHIFCGYYWYQFKNNLNTHTHVFYRWFNEIPTVLLFVIVIMVVIKP